MAPKGRKQATPKFSDASLEHLLDTVEVRRDVLNPRDGQRRFTNLTFLAWQMVTMAVSAKAAQKRSTKSIQVVLGAHSLSKGGEEQQIFTVKRMIPHSLYNSKLISNDIMLLQLEGTATLNKFVNVLSLPCGEDVKDGVICNVAGWGRTRIQVAEGSDKLQQVNVTIIDRELCSQYYAYHPAITTDVLCAGDKKIAKDSCSGDSGGPLLCNGNLNGIVSFGCGCGKPNKPGVYTRLSKKYLHWIKNTIQN
ncbi:granzyme K-like [Cetorhinus maximus]